MKELTRFELATIKRIAKSTKTLRDKRDKLNAKIASCQEELQSVLETIKRFEVPIMNMTGGFTSEEVLNGLMESIEEKIEELGEIPVNEIENNY